MVIVLKRVFHYYAEQLEELQKFKSTKGHLPLADLVLVLLELDSLYRYWMIR